MCWGVPAKVLDSDGVMAKVDFGGSIKDVLVIDKDIKPGDLVIVHAGTIIGKIDNNEIVNTLKIYGDLVETSLIDEGIHPEKAKEIVEKWVERLLGDESNG